jgi:hypothetical protein
LAVSCYELWGRILFKIVSAPIVQVEVSVVANFGRWLGFNLGLDGIRFISPNGWSIFMMEDCSSFHNISLAVLVWLSLIKLGGAKATGLTATALCAGISAIVCLNALRILLMTPSEDAYHFWHYGNGAMIFSCLTLAVIAFPTTASMRLRDV